MTIMNLIMFVLGITTAFSIVGVIALRDWYKGRAKKTEEDEEESALRTPRT